MRTAMQWGGDEVASRIRFSEVAQKEEHIIRCRVADIFLDTVEVSISFVNLPLSLIEVVPVQCAHCRKRVCLTHPHFTWYRH